MKRTRTLGLIVTDIQNPFFPELVQAADNAARTLGYSIILGSAAYDEHRAVQYLDLMVDRRVDGLIIASSQVSEESWRWLASSPVPVVVVNAEPGASDVTVVTSDNVGGGRMAAEHLLGLGHRRIAYIRGYEGFTADVPRIEGFRAACQAAGIPAADLIEVRGDGQVAGGERAAAVLLAAAPRVTAIGCHNDMTAIGALRATPRGARARPAGHQHHRLRRHRGRVMGRPGADDGRAAEDRDGPHGGGTACLARWTIPTAWRPPRRSASR